MPLTTIDTFQTLQARGHATTAKALALFDQLAPVDIAFMMGRWRGSEFPTGHFLDGVLTVANWYGKEFVNPDCVHPLLCLDSHNQIIKLATNPVLFKLVMSFALPKHPAFKPLYTWLTSWQTTEDSQANLRMVTYRGQASATMIYNQIPVQDMFRKIDEDTVLGLMEYSGFSEPFFFVLQRDVPQTHVMS